MSLARLCRYMRYVTLLCIASSLWTGGAIFGCYLNSSLLCESRATILWIWPQKYGMQSRNPYFLKKWHGWPTKAEKAERWGVLWPAELCSLLTERHRPEPRHSHPVFIYPLPMWQTSNLFNRDLWGRPLPSCPTTCARRLFTSVSYPVMGSENILTLEPRSFVTHLPHLIKTRRAVFNPGDPQQQDLLARSR